MNVFHKLESIIQTLLKLCCSSILLYFSSRIVFFLSRLIFSPLQYIILSHFCTPVVPYVPNLFFLKILFIYSRETQRARQRHRQRKKQALCGEPDAGFNPRTLGSWPEPKADAEPLSHPGASIFQIWRFWLILHWKESITWHTISLIETFLSSIPSIHLYFLLEMRKSYVKDQSFDLCYDSHPLLPSDGNCSFDCYSLPDGDFLSNFCVCFFSFLYGLISFTPEMLAFLRLHSR